MVEDIHDSLQAIFKAFDQYCHENGCPYNIVSDEQDCQGYVLQSPKHSTGLYDYLQPVIKNKNVHLRMDHNRPDGVLFTFTLKSIADGYWKPLSDKRRPEEFSIFTKKSDVDKVRAGRTMYQSNFNKRLSKILEDQYKSATGYHRRQQSQYRSSFSKSKSFGGLSEAVVGSSIPVGVETTYNVGLAEAPRTNDIDGKGDKVRPYPDRNDATDNPELPPVKNSGMKAFLSNLENRLSHATTVIPDDEASKQASDETGGLQAPDVNKTSGMTVNKVVQNGNTPRSNVRVSNLRSIDGPEISSGNP